MPLVHRLSGIGFASDEEKRRLRESQAAYPFRSPQTSRKPAGATLCKLCAARASTFDLSILESRWSTLEIGGIGNKIAAIYERLVRARQPCVRR